MSNPLRFLVLALVLLSLAGTAATLQFRIHRHTKARLAESGLSPGQRAMVMGLQADRQQAFLVMVGASLAAVVVVSLVSSFRRETPGTLDRLKTDMDQVDRLARTTVSQAEALAQERDTRIRTEETLHLEQLKLNQALEEKIRLGRDLHDGIIQSLYAAGLTLESSRQKRPAHPEEADALVGRGINLLNATIRDVRGYIETLGRSSPAAASGFGADVRAMLDALRGDRSAVLSVHLDEAAEHQLDAHQRAELLQSVREASSNALRHGKAGHITVRLHEDGTRLALLVQDDGVGFEPQRASGCGLGLVNLHARATALGGELRITSRPGEGTRVVMTFPTRRPLS